MMSADVRLMEFTYQFSVTLYDKSPCGRFLLFIILSRDNLWQLSDDRTDFISLALIDSDSYWPGLAGVNKKANKNQ